MWKIGDKFKTCDGFDPHVCFSTINNCLWELVVKRPKAVFRNAAAQYTLELRSTCERHFSWFITEEYLISNFQLISLIREYKSFKFIDERGHR